MRTHHSILVVASIVAVACSGKPEEAKKEHVVFGEYVQPEDSFPRMRYLESGLIAPNDRCAVRKVRLNPKMPPVYVNGRPIGFC